MNTGRNCDFLSFATQRPVILKLAGGSLQDFAVLHFEYFRDVCTKDFSLYFQEASWERIVLQAACFEQCIWHAAQAIAALTRSHYHPSELGDAQYQTELAIDYSTRHYSWAIQALNSQLSSSTRGWEFAILASIFFIAIEVLQGHNDKVQIHLRSAFAILEAYPNAGTNSISNIDQVQLSSFTEVNYGTIIGKPVRSTSDLDCIISALYLIDEQASSFTVLH